MRTALIAGVFLLSSLISTRSVLADPQAREAALAAIAAGRLDDGIATLRKAAGEKSSPELVCLLGRFELIAGRFAEAERTFARVPADAECARQAAFGQADALVALKRADEAAALYARHGAPALGLERDRAVVAWLEELAGRALGEDKGDLASQLYGLALLRPLPPADRVALGQRVAEALQAVPAEKKPGMPSGLDTALLQGLLAKDDAAARRSLARFLPTEEGLDLLLSLPPDPATLEVAAELAALVDVERALPLLDQLSKMTGESAQKAGRTATMERGKLGYLGQVGAALRALAAGQGDAARDASNLELDLLERAGDRPALVGALERHLQRFPADPRRTENEGRLDRTRLDQARAALLAGRHAEAITVFDALVTRDPRSDLASTAAYEAALAARAAGQRPEAKRRLDELMARWPESDQAGQAVAALARIQAFDEGNPAGAQAWLEKLERESALASAASTELARLKAPHIALRTTRQAPGRAVQIEVITRNLQEVEARLHKVDAEAYLRAGGDPTTLPDLDVAVIAPDQRWKVKVPGFTAQKDIAFPLTVPDGKPGLYVVTVASEDREASAVLWISDLRLVAQVVGPDLAVATFRGDQPADDVEVLVRLPDGRIERGTTNDSGLWIKRLPATGALTLLARDDDGGPALVSLAVADNTPGEATVQLSADFDRPIYRAGDTVHFRVVARKDGQPVRGTFGVWLEGGHRVGYQKLEASALGTVQGRLPVPPIGGRGLWRRSYAVMVQVPGEDAPQSVAQVQVAPEGPAERSIEVEMVGSEAVITVRGVDEGPAPGVLVAWTAADGRDGKGRTDARGRLAVAGPPTQLGWHLTAQVAGTDLQQTAYRKSKEFKPLQLQISDVAAGTPVRGTLTGPDGTYRLTWAALAVPEAERPKGPVDPWVPEFELGLEGADGEPDEVAVAAGPTAPEREARTREVVIKNGSATLELADLAVGTWSVRAASLDGRGPSARKSIMVGEKLPGLAGLRDVRLGERLELVALGTRPALVVAGQDRILAAAVLRPGQAVAWPVMGEWPTQLGIHQVGSDGRARRQDIEVDPNLKVSLTGSDTADGWRLAAQVVDGAGRPVVAEVALRVVDDVLASQAGATPLLDAGSLRRSFASEAAAAVFGDVVHAVEASAIAAELMAEAAREAESEKARRASRGRLQMNAVNDVLAAPPLVEEIGLGGIGTVGHGAGGGGYGRGFGSAAVRMGKAEVRAQRFIQGERGEVAWAVLTTNAQGEASLVVPRPRRATRWTLWATAVAASGFGQAELPLDTTGTVRLRVPTPGPGLPGETMQPVVRVHNGRAAALPGTLKINGKGQPVQVPAGESIDVALGAQVPGTTLEIVLETGGGVADRQVWTWPLAEGRPDPAGQVLHIAAAPGGGLPVARLALRPDPAFGIHAGRTASAGRAALAALAFAAPGEQAALAARVVAVRDALRGLPGEDPRAAAEVLLFLAEARTRLGIPRGEIDAAAQGVGSPGADPEERVAVLFARAAAGLEVDASALARLERTEGQSPEVASRLARLLILQGRKAEAAPFIKAGGPQALRARAALGQKDEAGRKALASQAPPGIGDYGLADWIAAVGSSPGNAKGIATLQVGGKAVGTLDRAAGGEVRVAVDGALGAVSLDGLDALVWRSLPAPAGDAAAVLTRLPVGLDGGPLNPGARGEAGEGCADPCVLAVGDALAVEGALDALGFAPPGGLPVVDLQQGPVLLAVAPGRYVLRGLVNGEGAQITPRIIEVKPTAGPEGLARVHALARAQQAVTAEEDPAAWLAPWPADADWPDNLLAGRSSVRFRAALLAETDAATRIDRFEALREASPSESLTSEQVAAVARAYQQSGRAARAVDVWRVGLGGAFLAEAATARQVEDVAGLLASLQGLRRVAARYPALPAVEEALFYLPQRLDQMATAEGELPEPVVQAKITRTDLRLMAAAWDREFIALWPKSERRPEAAFHLVSTLQLLDAHAEAAKYAESLAKQHKDSPLLDGLLYLEGLSRLRLREDGQARGLFDRIAQGEFPQEDGSTGPAQSRDDARYALARLHEARGDLKAAKTAYEGAASTHEEAAEAVRVLSDVTLRAERFVEVAGGESLALPLILANLDTVNLRAYRLDLRTIFLRDGGLDAVLSVNVSGVSPIWSDERDVKTDHFPREYPIKLPLGERGAYLVQIEGGGKTATALVVRTDLSLDVTPATEGLRAAVRLKGKPAAGIALRSAGNGSVAVGSTDVRGVAHVPGPNVLAFTDKGDLAFTAPAWTTTPLETEELQTYRQSLESRAPAPAPAQAPKRGKIDERLEQQMQKNEALYEQNFRRDGDANIDANML